MSLAEELARKVWDDICDRRGLKWEAQKVDPDVRDGEIVPRWASYFNEALERAAIECDAAELTLKSTGAKLGALECAARIRGLKA